MAKAQTQSTHTERQNRQIQRVRNTDCRIIRELNTNGKSTRAAMALTPQNNTNVAGAGYGYCNVGSQHHHPGTKFHT